MRTFVRWAALAGLASLGIVWSLQEQIVQLIYDERLPRFINSLFKNRDRHDVERYVADTRALLSSVFPYLAALMAVALFAATQVKDASRFLQRWFEVQSASDHMPALESDASRNGTRRSKIHALFAVAVSALFALVATAGLGTHMTVDEPKWLFNRVPAVANAWDQGDWSGTEVNDKPGYLPAALAALSTQDLGQNFHELNLPQRESFLTRWRFPIVLFNSVGLLVLYAIVTAIAGSSAGLASQSLVASLPTFLGISRIVNPDATVVLPMLIAFLTAIYGLQHASRRAMGIAGFVLGLALISKFVATAVYPGVIVASGIFLALRATRVESPRELLELWLVFGATSIATVWALYPATWENLGLLARTTLLNMFAILGILGSACLVLLVFLSRRIQNALLGPLFGIVSWATKLVKVLTAVWGLAAFGVLAAIWYSPHAYDEWRLSSARGDISLFVTMFNMVLPWVILPLPLIVATAYVVANSHRIERTRLAYVLSLASFTILGLVGYSLTGYAVSGSYVLPLLLTLIVACVIGIYSLDTESPPDRPSSSFIGRPFFIARRTLKAGVHWLSGVARPTHGAVRLGRRLAGRPVVAVLLTLTVFSSYQVAPYYYPFTNSLAPRDAQFVANWGLGGYPVAVWLNDQHSVEKPLKVWFDREGTHEFFNGIHFWRGSSNPHDIDGLDYVVLTNEGLRIFEWSIRYRPLGNYAAVWKADNFLLKQVSQGTPVFENCTTSANHSCVRVFEWP